MSDHPLYSGLRGSIRDARRRGGASISTAATRTMGRCRWITSSGRRSRRSIPSSWTPGSRRRSRRGGSAPICARRWRGCACSVSTARPSGIVVLTHLHYDHVGNLDAFPQATFMYRRRRWPSGRAATRAGAHFRTLVEPEDVLFLVRENFARRVHYVRETAEIVPGITVHRVGGHAAGLQVVRVPTARGNVVLASDATHFYCEYRGRSPVQPRPRVTGDVRCLRHGAGARGYARSISYRGTIRS